MPAAAAQVPHHLFAFAIAIDVILTDPALIVIVTVIIFNLYIILTMPALHLPSLSTTNKQTNEATSQRDEQQANNHR